MRTGSELLGDVLAKQDYWDWLPNYKPPLAQKIFRRGQVKTLQWSYYIVTGQAHAKSVPNVALRDNQLKGGGGGGRTFSFALRLHHFADTLKSIWWREEEKDNISSFKSENRDGLLYEFAFYRKYYVSKQSKQSGIQQQHHFSVEIWCWFPASSGPLPCQPHILVLYIGFAPGELWENQFIHSTHHRTWYFNIFSQCLYITCVLFPTKYGIFLTLQTLVPRKKNKDKPSQARPVYVCML